MAGVDNNALSQTSQDLWSEWKSRIGMLRSALVSRSSDSSLSELTSGCLALYRDACRSKQCNAAEALANISGRDRSPLELAFMWLGGWRPTSAIMSVHSTLSTSLREQSGISEANSTGTVPVSTFLAREQLEAIGTLQKLAQDTEACLSNELAFLQMLVVNQSMTEALTTDVISMLGPKDWNKGRDLMEANVADLTRFFIQANQLRLQTLEELMRLLSPTQCAKCCISAFELVNAIKALRSTAQQNGNV